MQFAAFVSQHGAAGGEDPESSGPAGEGRQRLLRPVCEDLPAARQEEEVPDEGDPRSRHVTDKQTHKRTNKTLDL